MERNHNLYDKFFIMSTSLVILLFSFSSHSKNLPILSIEENNLLSASQCNCNCDELSTLIHAPITNKNLMTWAKTVSLSIFSYGFGNYSTALEHSSRYFTPQGWAEFKRALDKSGNLEEVKKNNLVVTSRALKEAEIIKNVKSSNDQEFWEIQLPIEVTYQNAIYSSKQNLLITLEISKKPTAKTMSGLGITQFIAEPAQSATGKK